MELLYKYTGYLRKQYFENLYPTAIKLGIALIVSAIIMCLFDYFVPFTSFYNFIRVFVLLGGAFIVFSAGYLVTFFFSQANRVKNLDYVPVKDRFSPNWRKRISIIAGALIFAVISSTDKTVFYTLVNSFVVAIIVALIIFLTKSEEEVDRELYGVPDVRDNIYNANIKKAREKKVDKKNKKSKESDKV